MWYGLDDGSPPSMLGAGTWAGDAMLTQTFRDVIADADELRTLVGEPSELVKRKELPALEPHSRAFIARSPFLLLGTANADGTCDVSPRGDAPGFVHVLDDRTLAIPERPGNRRVDSLSNILANPNVGLLFIVPGTEETLRVNGRAVLSRDPDLLQQAAVKGKPPVLVIGVEVREAFMHCAKSFKRARLWDAASWPDRSELPSLARILKDQLTLPQPIEELDAYMVESYKRLY